MTPSRDRRTQSIHRKSATILLGLLMFAVGASFQEPAEPAEPAEKGSEHSREAFLSSKGAEAFEILARNPDLIEERSVQVKIYRSQRSKDPQVLAAAYRLCFQMTGLEATAPMIHRRCNGAFIGSNPALQGLLLELALENPDLRKDLRVVGLISTALHSQDETLQKLGGKMVEEHPELEGQPAIREALGEANSGLPDYALFRETVNPIFSASGSDERACVNCHNSRPVLFLPMTAPGEDEEPVIRQRYRSVLRVLDLENLPASLILNKPTLPMAEDSGGSSSPDHHTGGVRFEQGDETYERILKWIQSAQPEQ